MQHIEVMSGICRLRGESGITERQLHFEKTVGQVRYAAHLPHNLHF